MKILDYNVPPAGSRKQTPYGTMKIEHAGRTKTVPFGSTDGLDRNFVTFLRRRYYFRNVGTLRDPKFEFDGNQECETCENTTQ